MRVLPFWADRGRGLARVVESTDGSVDRLIGIVAVLAILWHMLLLVLVLHLLLLRLYLLAILLLPLLLHLLLLPLHVELLLLVRVLLPLQFVLLRVLPLDLELLLQLLLPRSLLALELLDLAPLRIGPLVLLPLQYYRLLRVVRDVLLRVAVAQRRCAIDDHRRTCEELLAVAHRVLYLRLDVPVKVVQLGHQARVYVRELWVVREHLSRRAARCARLFPGGRPPARECDRRGARPSFR